MSKKIQFSKLAILALGAMTAFGCASSSNASADGDKETLVAALDDEYRAEATYAAVMQKFGEIRPFVNIIEAERRHAARVKTEMKRLSVSYKQDNPYLGKIAAPDTLLQACQQGIAAEKENIELYDRLLPMIKDGQVRETLSALQRASRERHLPAFERCVARGGAMGGGRGRGRNQ